MPANNEDFIKAAFAAGLSKDQVKQAVAERNQRQGSGSSAVATDNQPAATTAQALFPRTSQASQEGAGLGRKVLSAGMDALSLPFRAAGAAGRAVDTHEGWTGTGPQSFTQSLNQINQGKNAMGEGGSLVSNLEKDPSTLVTAMVPMGELAKGASWAAKAGYGAMQGAKLGAVSAGTHQLDNAAQGKDMSLAGAGTEVGLNAAGGALFPALGSMAQAGGKKIINSLVRPSTKLEQFGYGSAGREAENVGHNTVNGLFEHGAVGNSLAETAQKVNDTKELLGQQMGAALAHGQAAGNHIDPYNIIDQTIEKIQANPDDFAGPLTGLHAAKADILDELNTLHAMKKIEPGDMSLTDIQALKTRLGKMAKWDSNKGGTATQELAKAVNRNLDQALDQAAPGIDKLNQSYQQMKGASDALQARLPVHNRNNAVSLSTFAALMGGPKVLAAQLASKSPMVARGLYQGGGALMNPEMNRLGNYGISEGINQQ